MRTAEVSRNTNETQIRIKVDVDGSGRYEVATGIGFFDHMLELFSKHSGIDIEVHASGDIDVDAHHTVEDAGIVLGQALCEALGSRKGIERYASVMLPMDEVRVDVAVDLGGRSNLVFEVQFPQGSYDKEKGFDYSLLREFMKALTDNLKATVQIYLYKGINNHHIAEAVFKGLARTLRQAVRVTSDDIPSTKGVL